MRQIIETERPALRDEFQDVRLKQIDAHTGDVLVTRFLLEPRNAAFSVHLQHTQLNLYFAPRRRDGSYPLVLMMELNELVEINVSNGVTIAFSCPRTAVQTALIAMFRPGRPPRRLYALLPGSTGTATLLVSLSTTRSEVDPEIWTGA